MVQFLIPHRVMTMKNVSALIINFPYLCRHCTTYRNNKSVNYIPTKCNDSQAKNNTNTTNWFVLAVVAILALQAEVCWLPYYAPTGKKETYTEIHLISQCACATYII